MIPSDRIRADGTVDIWEKTEDGPRQVRLAATDAVHAIQTDPDRWSLDEPVPPPEPEEKPRRRGRHHESEDE